MKPKTSGLLIASSICTALGVLACILGGGLLLIGSSQHPATEGGRIGQAAGHVFISLIGGIAFFSAAFICLASIVLCLIYMFTKSNKNYLAAASLLILSLLVSLIGLASFITIIRNQ